jgi:hypothetical protein
MTRYSAMTTLMGERAAGDLIAAVVDKAATQWRSRCEGCGEYMCSADFNLEAWEVTDKVLCPDCAESAFDAMTEGSE